MHAGKFLLKHAFIWLGDGLASLYMALLRIDSYNNLLVSRESEFPLFES